MQPQHGSNENHRLCDAHKLNQLVASTMCYFAAIPIEFRWLKNLFLGIRDSWSSSCIEDKPSRNEMLQCYRRSHPLAAVTVIFYYIKQRYLHFFSNPFDSIDSRLWCRIISRVICYVCSCAVLILCACTTCVVFYVNYFLQCEGKI